LTTMTTPWGQRTRQSLSRFAVLVAVAACAPAPVATTSPAPANVARVLRAPTSVWGFTAPWDPRSDSSVIANAARLDAVVTGWIQLDSVSGEPSLLYPDDPTRPGAPRRRFALVTSWQGRRFHPELVRRAAAEPSALSRIASRVSEIVLSNKYEGIVLDLEDQARGDTTALLATIRSIGSAARTAGATVVAVASPAGDTAAYPTRLFFPAADAAIVMLYDEHWSTSAPGPVATPEWVRRTLAQRVADVGADRLIAALPLYGYLWRGTQAGEPLSFTDARRAASEANVDLSRDPSSESLHAVQPNVWELWMTDAEQLRILVDQVTELGVRRLALWRLGQEDPAVWRTISR
jgi:peptidoglycan-N-acetylglucosamine deacetylase